MATFKPRPKIKRKKIVPPDYLHGSQFAGGKYTAWDTYGQGKPDFGKGAGPGSPYRKVEKTVGERTFNPKRPLSGSQPKPKTFNRQIDPVDIRTKIIRRRLGW